MDTSARHEFTNITASVNQVHVYNCDIGEVDLHPNTAQILCHIATEANWVVLDWTGPIARILSMNTLSNPR